MCIDSLRVVFEEIVFLMCFSGGGILEIVDIKDDLILIMGKNFFLGGKGLFLLYYVYYVGLIV